MNNSYSSAVNTEAIVLRRTDYGEADRIVSLLTPELGKISVLAKGVRKPASKLAGGIEPLALVGITVRRGKGELYTLTSAQMQISWSNIIKDFDRLQLTYFVLKTVNRAAETLHDPALFELLKTSLESLNDTKIESRVTIAWFHANLLQTLGQGLNLSRDTLGSKLSDSERYRFSPDNMAFEPHKNGVFTADHLKFLKLLHLRLPAAITRVGGVERVINECLSLLENMNN